MKPLVSIVIPNRNHGHTLPRLLDSVLRQTLKEVEVVVSDDCSDIPYTDVLEAYKAKGLNLRFVASPTRLYTKNARLAGIKAATADIIAFADADDMLWGESTLEAHVRQFMDEKADVLQFRSVFTDSYGNFTDYYCWADPWTPFKAGSEIFASYVKQKLSGFVTWNKLYSRELWLAIMPYAWESKIYRYAEDIFLATLFLFHARRYVGSEHIGYGWHREDKRNVDSAERTIYAYLMLKELIPYFTRHNCNQQTLDAFAKEMKHILRANAERLALATANERNCNAAILDEITQIFSKELLIKALLVGTMLNAEIVVESIPALLGNIGRTV